VTVGEEKGRVIFLLSFSQYARYKIKARKETWRRILADASHSEEDWCFFFVKLNLSPRVTCTVLYLEHV